jgi:hypothetical protein
VNPDSWELGVLSHIQMKKISFTLIFFAISVLVLAQHESQRYAVKSGHVEYKISGNTTGTKSIWWDDYGAKSRTEENTVNIVRMLGITNETRTHMVSIIDGDRFWTADLIEQTGETGTIPVWVGEYEYGSLSESERKEFEMDILESFGGRIAGQETVMGYECDIIELMGAQSWIYKGVALKTEASMLGISVKEMAVQFDENAHVSASIFEPPTGIQYISMDEMQRDLYTDGFDAFMGDDLYDDYDDYEDEDIVPLDYSYEKFREIVNGFSYKGFSPVMVFNDDGQYIASFIGVMGSISIIATSDENEFELGDFKEYESFRHSGKQFHYGFIEEDIEDGTGSALIEEYPREDMYITILAIPSMTKEALLEVAGQLKF